MTNEFEDLGIEELDETEETAGEPAVFTAKQNNNVISSGNSGIVLDWNTAPDSVKAPPRIDLDKKTVIIKKADIIMPPLERAWQKTKKGDKEFKSCQLLLYYDIDGQQENYSGSRVFARLEGDVKKYSFPTLTRDRKNQASALLGKYADFKKKDIAEISLKEFMAFLNSKPKARIKTEEVENPETQEKIKKNIIEVFLSN